MFIWLEQLNTSEVKMASKTIAAIAIVLLMVVVVFFVNTRLLLSPILDRLSLHGPEATPKAVLRADGYLDEANSPTGFYAIAYSVSNLGSATAENVTLEVAVDGETQANMVIPSLSASDSSNYSLEVSASGSLHVVSLQASCTDTADAYSFSFGGDVSRTFSETQNLSSFSLRQENPVW